MMNKIIVNYALKEIANLEDELEDVRRSLEEEGEINLSRELKHSSSIDEKKRYLNRWVQENE